MTRIFKMVVLGAMLVGLVIAPLGIAQADENGRSGGANGVTLEVPLPTVGTPSLTVTIDGEPTTIGGQEALGGKLRIDYLSSSWHVTETHNDACQPGEVGKSVSLNALSPTATLEAVYIAASGARTGLQPTSVPGRNPRFDYSFCV